MNPSQDGISVIIPCFNAAGTVGATIKSVLAQDDVRVDLTVVDDGSTDNSLAVIRSFEPAIRVLTGPNRGVSAARNRGIKETRGEWIVFLDSDDLLLPGTLRNRLNTVPVTGADVVICEWQELAETAGGFVDGPVRSVDRVEVAKNAEIACATNVWATTAAIMYHRSLVEKIGGFRDDLPIIQDARFLFDAAYHGARFVHSPHVGARYRVSEQSLSRGNLTLFWRDALANGVQIAALWQNGSELTVGKRSALAQIFNAAAHGLFQVADPQFRDAIAQLNWFGLPLTWRNRLAVLLGGVLGLKRAAQAAALWSVTRRSASRLVRLPSKVHSSSRGRERVGAQEAGHTAERG